MRFIPSGMSVKFNAGTRCLQRILNGGVRPCYASLLDVSVEFKLLAIRYEMFRTIALFRASQSFLRVAEYSWTQENLTGDRQMKFLSRLFGFQKNARKRNPQRRPQAAVEGLEERVVLTASPLPVLMVIADQQDFYYQEYGQTRQAIEAEGVSVQVAATSMATSYSHPGTGEPEGSNGAVVPDLALADVDPDNYSAIVFVGGWGSSMYQYAFDGDYLNNHYDGDLATKQIVNDLINEFVADDKYITGICHGTTVLAWARVDGVSPLNGKVVSVPYIGSPAVNYNGYDYGNYELGQYEQAVANGAIANTSPGQYGVAGTASDDVVVDGRVITAENYDSALEFGRIVAEQVIAAAEENAVPENQAPKQSSKS